MGLQRSLLLAGAILFIGSIVIAIPLDGPMRVGQECNFYAQKASALHCSARNYLVRFGERYCREFERVEPYFTPYGQKVLNCIRPCLIDALERPELTCNSAQPIAFASHVKCYSQCGFCEMPPSDQVAIGAVVWREFFDPEFRAVMDEVSRRCLANLKVAPPALVNATNPR